MTVHIGSIIKELVKAKGMSVEDFSKKINYTRRNSYKIFDKPSIDTALLMKISKVIGENLFFRFIKDEEIALYTNDKIKSSQIMEALKELNISYTSLRGELTLKKSIVKKSKAAKKTSIKKKN